MSDDRLASGARLERVQSLFFEALDRDPDERSAFLRRACGEDRKLYDEVESLLAVDDHSVFAVDPLEASADLDASADVSMLGQRVGPYEVTSLLGSGGMGTVFLAERADGQFAQTVALKLVKRGMDTDAVIARFNAERQILARLSHPNIGRLLDGGVHVDGRPYFALEYVAGLPITEYCESRNLTAEARLRLVEDVCGAVAYAHRNLVVHRDLKPSNILVSDTSSEGESKERPTVKLLDFGIAKLLTGDADVLQTRTGERALTPAYAAPEQLKGEAITTATDVYGLGVVLHEVLTGERPSVGFGGQDPRLGEASLTTSSPLRTTLRGDLRTIVTKALREAPERRYVSAHELLSDLRAYRLRLPISARPESAVYRMRKYVERNRIGVVAAAAVFLVGLVLITFYTIRLSQERDKAQLEAQKAEQVSGFLRGLFEVADPRESGGADVTARELLDRGAARIDDELAAQPEVRAQMMQLIGEVYTTLGSYEEAEAQLQKTLRLRREAPPSPEAEIDLGRTLVSLGLLLENQGRFGEAELVLQESVEVLGLHQGDVPLEHADALHALAFAKLRLAQFDESEALIREALRIKDSVIGESDSRVAYSLNILGDVLTFQKRFDEAEAVHLRALAMRRETLGEAHLDVAYTLHNLGATLRDAGRYDEAESHYREAIAVWRRHYGYDHQEGANTLSQLAFVVGMQDRFEVADSLHGAALDMALGSVGPDHPKVAAMNIRRGDTFARAGRIADAEASYRLGVETQRRVLGDTHPTVTRWQITLAVLNAQLGRTEQAMALLRASAARCDVPAEGGYTGCTEQVESALRRVESL